MKLAKHYTYMISWSEELKAFQTSCLEFPKLEYVDTNRSKALKGIHRMVELKIDFLLEDDEQLPGKIEVCCIICVLKYFQNGK